MSFKDALLRGQPVSLINVDHASASLVEVIGPLGVDAVMIDCEQGSADFSDLENMTRAAHLAGLASLVRIPSADRWVIERHLGRGVDGVVIPRLDTAAQAAQAVARVRYCCPTDFDKKTVIIQVESASAVAELDGFLDVPDVDCLFIGPVDLSKSLEFGGNYRVPDVVDILDDIIRRAVDAAKPVGFLVKEDDVRHWQAKGVTMIYGHVNDFVRIGARHWCRRAGLGQADDPLE